ncbi:hypothetical protein J7E88_34910 [Streptomyces sp. ISL-10]|uniref:hypothetical protein n=1 Tax=Streptomyces sp. ISL-10 TaxID=2819172 RepID=UPI001BE551AC|nr:hypothetical protein [Streptomyces sp. ISL-10]MBT2370325.1 hypothetical protein [Streptomyces sp. ISL-10]
MFRGATAQTVLALLAATLFTLPFFTLEVPFAPAHATRHVEAKAQSGINPSSMTLCDEAVTFRDVGYLRGPAGVPRSLDRHRVSDSATQPPERPMPAHDPAAADEPVAPSVGHDRPSGFPTAHFPAALQVFRC